MRNKGYDSYRGRASWKSFLKVLTVVILALLLLGIVAAIYLQQFLVVSSDGVRLDLPFFQHDSNSSDPSTPTVSPSPEPSFVIVTPSPEPTPDPAIEALHPVNLPLEVLYNGTVQSQIEAAGGDCAVFDMKADSGALGYASSIELAQYTKQTSTDSSINAAIQTTNEIDGLYTIARVSCFKDHNITDWERSLSIFTNSGYRWTDPDNIRWISPTNPDVRDYLTAICVELAELGFDEILLDNAGYPSKGNLHYIKKGEAYDQSQFSSVIDGFYAQVAAALEEYEITLSVVTTSEALSGQDTLTGQTPANLVIFDRHWTFDESETISPNQSVSPTS